MYSETERAALKSQTINCFFTVDNKNEQQEQQQADKLNLNKKENAARESHIHRSQCSQMIQKKNEHTNYICSVYTI